MGSDIDVLYVANLGEVINRIDLFKKCLPNVEPFYAIKSNPDPVVLKLLGKSGLGFDCASNEEIEAVLRIDVPPEKMIFAHPTKQISHLELAKRYDVSMMTFDCESELHKIKEIYPEAELVIRMLVDSSKSEFPMGTKFGVKKGCTKELLTKAKQLQLNVIGVSFHVGSTCLDLETYVQAVQDARAVFDEAASLGYEFTLLDIGGGFPGAIGTEEPFRKIAETLQKSLKDNFFLSSGIRIIAEPGRYFIDGAFSSACEITAVKIAEEGIGKENGSVELLPRRWSVYVLIKGTGIGERELSFGEICKTAALFLKLYATHSVG
eukprot:gene5736-10990_t